MRRGDVVMKRALLAALVSSLTFGGAVRAQDSADDAKKAAALDEARQHVARAKVHYDLGEFKEAADEYITVYRLRPIPAILFNVAQAYRQGGLYEKARQFYKSYLRESPEAKNRAMIEQAIKEMDDLLAKERHTKDAQPTGVKEPAEASLPLAAKSAAKAGEPKAAEPAPKLVETPPAKTAPPPQTVAVAKPPASSETRAAAPPPVKPAVATASPKPSVPPDVTRSTPAPAPAVEEDDPLYKKWWLWAAVGVVAAGAGVAAVTLGGNAAPTSHFGTTPVFP